MEVNREPDVYVKTALTFGDKPAPAMAQIALRKTADQANASYPEAVQVVKDNTYMDDICHSVRSEKEAKRLTTELDEVLLTDGRPKTMSITRDSSPRNEAQLKPLTAQRRPRVTSSSVGQQAIPDHSRGNWTEV